MRLSVKAVPKPINIPYQHFGRDVLHRLSYVVTVARGSRVSVFSWNAVGTSDVRRWVIVQDNSKSTYNDYLNRRLSFFAWLFASSFGYQ